MPISPSIWNHTLTIEISLESVKTLLPIIIVYAKHLQQFYESQDSVKRNSQSQKVAAHKALYLINKLILFSLYTPFEMVQMLFYNLQRQMFTIMLNMD